MIVMGFDPGGTTGWAVYKFTEGDTPEQDDIKWERGQLEERNHHEALWQLLLAEMPDVIVSERFQLRNNLAANTAALEYVGVLRCFAQIANIPFYEQTPSQAKGFWTDAKLRKCTLYIPSLGHAMDATRHVLYWLMQTKQLPPEYLQMQARD